MFFGPNRLFASLGFIVLGAVLGSACGPDPRPLVCPEPHALFDVLVVSADGDLPPDTLIRVTYGGSSIEEYRAAEPGDHEVVFCKPSTAGGMVPPAPPDAGASSDGGEGGAAASDPDAGAGDPDAGHGAGALPALRCELYTQGPATFVVEASGHATATTELKVDSKVCTVTTTIEIVPVDGGA